MRNKIRRQIKSILLNLIDLVPPAHDYVIVVKDGYLGVTFTDLVEVFSLLFANINKEILNETTSNRKKEANN